MDYIGTPRHFKSEEDMIEWEANHQEAAALSECCGAEIRSELAPETVCAETGYRDGGWIESCKACGGETEPLVAIARKPVSRQQGELFTEVA